MNLVATIKEREEARSKMWASLIPGYLEADRNKKKKLKQEFRKNMTPVFNAQGNFITFDTCVAQASNELSVGDLLKCKKVFQKADQKQKGDNMYVEQNMTVKEKTTEDVRREHFLDQVSAIFYKKDSELREKFGLDVPKHPKTPKELVEWIKSGNFTYVKSYDPESDDAEDNWCRYEAPIHGIRWTKVKEDHKGYDAARESLDAEYTKFRNEIWAEVEPSNFLKILEKFEKVKLH